uniref:Filamin-A n=1 Tax=Toxocara canis TaxID=6265 RepID=A0A183UQL8_TOXCA
LSCFKLKVVFAGVEIPKVEINVKPHVDISGIRVEGLKDAIVTVNCEKEVHVFTCDGDNTRITIRSPSGRVVEALIEPTATGFRVRFTPSEIGDYTIEVTYEDIPIDESPFTLHSVPPLNEKVTPNGVVAEAEYVVSASEPPQAQLVKVTGPGLGTVLAARSTHVLIDATRAGFGNIDLYVDGPAKTPINCIDNHDGTCSMFYEPLVPGVYYLRVMFDDCHVPGSPFKILAQPPVSERLRRNGGSRRSSGHKGKGWIGKENVLLGHRKEIRVSTSGAVPSTTGLEAITEDPDGRRYLLKFTPESDDVFVGGWTAQKLGETKFSVFYDGIMVAEGKTIVREGQDASKCRAVGEGLERAIVGERTKFRIDTQGAGEGSIAMAIKGPSESKTTVTDHSNGSCTVEYVLLTPGLYEINIVYGEKKEPIPGSPFTTVADFRHDPSKVSVEGFEGKARIGVPTSFVVDATRTAALPIDVRLPVGQQQPIVEEFEPRRYRVTFTATGKPDDVVPVELLYGGEPVPASPLKVTLTSALEPDRVKLRDRSGAPFPSESRASLPATFIIDVSEAGRPDKLSAEVMGPDGRPRKSTIIATGDPNMYEVSFTPDIVGTYEMLVFFNGTLISRTPYRIHCVPVGDANKCILRDLREERLWGVGETRRFAVDVSNAGTGALSVIPNGSRDVEWSIEKGEGGIQYVILKPLTAGPHAVFLLYGGREIPNGVISFEVRSLYE